MHGMHGMHVDENNDPKPKTIDCQHLHFRVLKNEILFNLIAHHMSVKTYIFHDCQHLHLRVLKK